LPSRLGAWSILLVLPIILFGFYILAVQHYRPPIAEPVFPIVPEKFKGVHWVAVFIRTGCNTCRQLLGDLSRLLQHQPSANLPLLVLSLDSPQHIFQFQSMFSLPFSIYACNEYLTQPLGIHAVPAIYFIGPEGKIYHHWKGNSILTKNPDLILEFLLHHKMPGTTLAGKTDSKRKKPDNTLLPPDIPNGVQVVEIFYSNGVKKLARSFKVIPDCECDSIENTIYQLTTKTIQLPGDSVIKIDTMKNMTQKDVSNYLAQSWQHTYGSIQKQTVDFGPD